MGKLRTALRGYEDLIKMSVIKINWILNCPLILDFKKGIKNIFHNLMTIFFKNSEYFWLGIFLKIIQLHFSFTRELRVRCIPINLGTRHNRKSNGGMF